MTALPPETQELAGRHALVTGAGSGIGLATACALSRHGARVAAVVQNDGQVQTVRAALPDAVVLVQDLLDDAACAALPARAAQALGVSDTMVMWRHILPNAMVATLTFLPFILAGSVTTLTSLDFLGFGLPVGSPSLGELLLQGKNNLNAPWLAFTGFFIIALMLSLLVFIGEAVRDAFNPRKVPT